jgi:hypothetical protein
MMRRTDLHLKIELEHAEDEQPQRLAAEICRQVERMYSVRKAEVSNLISRED